MAQRCKVCTHPKRDAINQRLLKATESGESLASIGAAYGVSSSAIDRHKANHLQLAPTQVQEAKNALTIVGYAHDLYERAAGILETAEAMLKPHTVSCKQCGSEVEGVDSGSRSVQAAAASLREVRGSIELLARLVVTAPPEVEPAHNSWLDAALTDAVLSLSMAELPAGTQGEITEAVIIQAPQ